MSTVAWNVYLNGKLIDTVFFSSNCDGGAKITQEDVYDSLVNHDGYNPNIVVKRARK